jgi:hypothetical protein
VHLSSLVALVLVTVHAFTAGADASAPLVVGLAVMSSVVVSALAVVRVVHLGLARLRPVPAGAGVPASAPRTVTPARVGPPAPRDPRYDPKRDPLFLPRAVVTEEPPVIPDRDLGPVSLPSDVGLP